MTTLASYGPALHRYLMRRLTNAQRAQDLAQETCLRLWRVEHLELIREPQAYLFRIASRVVAEFYRRERRDPVLVDSRLVQCVQATTTDPQAADHAEDLITRDWLAHKLASLPPLHRQILLLRKHEQLSRAEIAKRLGLSPHTVKKYLWQAVAQIRLPGVH